MTLFPPPDALASEAAVLADTILSELSQGRQPRSANSTEKARIRRDALEAIARDIPDPYQFAWHLERPWCFQLATAYRSQDAQNAGCWRVKPEYAPDLFAMGVCDRDGFLGAFGNSVRKALLEQGA